MEIDREVIPIGAEFSNQCQILEHAMQTAASRQHDHFIETWIAPDDGRCQGLDDIADVCVGETLSQRANRRRREDDIANFAQTEEKNTQLPDYQITQLPDS